MAEFPIELIKGLASKEEQVRLIINGNANEYLLPEELLNEAWRFCEMAANCDAPSTPRQRVAIEALRSALDDPYDFLANYDRSSIAALIEADPHWLLLRERAADVLKAFEQLPYD